MKKEQNINECVKESITLALLKIMNKKRLEEIRVTEIVKVAGVGRTSFYRNFESKEDVLIQHINKIYADYFGNENNLSPKYDYKNNREFLIERFKFVKKNKVFFTVLNRNNLVDWIFRQIDIKNVNELYIINEENKVKRKYLIAEAAGGTSGIIIEWIKNNFNETEEELSEIFEKRI